MPFTALFTLTRFFRSCDLTAPLTTRCAATLFAVTLCAATHPEVCSATPENSKRLTERSFIFLWPGQSVEDARLDLNSPIVTDRPDFTEASSTVGRDVSQIELGYTYFYNGASSPHESSHVYPEALFRQGLFFDWLEFRVGQTLITNDSLGESATDFGNTYLGVKFGLIPQYGLIPEVSIVPQATVPTGSRGERSEHVLPGVNILFAWSLSEDTYLGGSSQVNRTEDYEAEDDDAGDISTTWAQAAVVGSRISEEVGYYIEWFGLFKDSVAGARDSHFANGGFTYLYSKDIQYDIRFGTRLQDRFGQEIFAGVGVSLRFL